MSAAQRADGLNASWTQVRNVMIYLGSKSARRRTKSVLSPSQLILMILACLAGQYVFASKPTESRPSDSEGAHFPHGAPSIAVFRWRECAASEVFFSIEIGDDGNARFVGSDKVREIGVMNTSYSPQRIDRLVAALKRPVKPSTLKKKADSAERLGHEEPYCIDSVLSGAHGNTDLHLSSASPADAEKLEAIEKVLAPKRWVCPVRGAVADSAFRDVWYCPEGIIALTIAVPEACFSYREVQIYSDGVVHQSAIEVADAAGAPTSRRVVGDQYYQVSKQTVESLLAGATAYPSTTEPMSDQSNEPSWVKRGTDEDVRKYAEMVARVVGVEWIGIDSPAGRCQKGKENRSLLSTMGAK